MKTKHLFLTVAAIGCLATVAYANNPNPRISGDYIEVRSCDVFTGPCSASSEIGHEGKEAILVWSVQQGAWNNVDLAGLTVIAIVRTDETLGDIKYRQPKGRTVLILDEKANPRQQAALADFAKASASKLIGQVILTRAEQIDIAIGKRTKAGARATVKAGQMVDISTRALSHDVLGCGNDYVYYPPLTKVQNAAPAFTQLFAYQGKGLNLNWVRVGMRSAFVAVFSR